ncbi:hypothetical protein TSUD_122740 [Trifolium subterraneum]|uniref:Neprosin PEP catalytic domain-containing protein n=1 Tax=Trifolium subterraneum TaxID=3900 RepID=A0A2Z6NJD4_TRISU|nr:hypothetical protein TSUD_122740 [Trifolium subterraneum]
MVETYDDDGLYGVSGTVTVYNPAHVELRQFSSAAIWIRHGPVQNSNLIIVGWHVFPDMYHDSETHLFVFWTDPNTTNWLVSINQTNIGYFPASLFNNMSYVDQVAWMRITANTMGTASPPMGSGVRLYPRDINILAYFKNLAFIVPARRKQLIGRGFGYIVTSNSQCYNAQYYGGNKTFPLTVQFGGPGGKCGVYLRSSMKIINLKVVIVISFITMILLLGAAESSTGLPGKEMVAAGSEKQLLIPLIDPPPVDFSDAERELGRNGIIFMVVGIIFM